MQSSTVMKRPNDPVDQPDANRHANPRPPKRNRVGFSSAANTDPRRFEREPAQQTNKPTRPVGQSRPLNRPFSDTSTDSEGDNLSEVARGDANTTTYNLPRPLRVNIGGRTLTLESGSVSFYSSTGADGRVVVSTDRNGHGVRRIEHSATQNVPAPAVSGTENTRVTSESRESLALAPTRQYGSVRKLKPEHNGIEKERKKLNSEPIYSA
ncbi:hypothetical protein J7T55_003936 [Diaporthe amygdali]|uniref:uncharacterized protein n=1 Tax=Phomopsis amygdali TaxID=1214568 RepID=UPI0022FDC86E|nr:uncharacterized protein J7T55_003936 [Diaporthe amygdali]KAJ0117519.1 hypothetical protein J7T55_003936 [Diaporthe amygdali]